MPNLLAFVTFCLKLLPKLNMAILSLLQLSCGVFICRTVNLITTEWQTGIIQSIDIEFIVKQVYQHTESQQRSKIELFNLQFLVFSSHSHVFHFYKVSSEYFITDLSGLLLIVFGFRQYENLETDRIFLIWNRYLYIFFRLFGLQCIPMVG